MNRFLVILTLIVHVAAFGCATASESHDEVEISQETLESPTDGLSDTNFIYGQITVAWSLDATQESLPSDTPAFSSTCISGLQDATSVEVRLHDGERVRSLTVSYQCRLITLDEWCVSGEIHLDSEPTTEFDWLCTSVDGAVQFSEFSDDIEATVTMAASEVVTPE